MVGSIDTYKVELRDLQSLLRKKLNENLVVVKYTVESLLPVGENYGSSILKVHAIVENNGRDEELNLVAKMLPPTDFQRTLFDSSYTFRKEAFLYEGILPAYQNLEKEFGMEDNKVIDILPKFYGARYSLISDDDFDEDAVILMENLKTLGYYTCNRCEGLDLEHSQAAVTALARFHALGIAIKHHKPDYFKTIKKWAKCMELYDTSKIVDRETFLKNVKNDSEMSVYYENLSDAMSYSLNERWMSEAKEPWATIIHNDLWVNNIMFCKDKKTNAVVDVKIVDFQNYLFMSPLRELIFLAFSSFNSIVLENHSDELFDLYHRNFVSVLEKMKCDVKDFTKEKFDERLKIDAYEEFVHLPFMINIIMKDVKDEATTDDIQSLVQETTESPIYLKKLRKLVKIYAQKGWLKNSNK